MLATARFVEPARGRELELIRDIFTDRLQTSRSTSKRLVSSHADRDALTNLDRV
jgi:hypothetical protein